MRIRKLQREWVRLIVSRMPRTGNRLVRAMAVYVTPGIPHTARTGGLSLCYLVPPFFPSRSRYGRVSDQDSFALDFHNIIS
jgi:hypothetical protein